MLRRILTMPGKSAAFVMAHCPVSDECLVAALRDLTVAANDRSEHAMHRPTSRARGDRKFSSPVEGLTSDTGIPIAVEAALVSHSSIVI
jgi:hypothetical protein